MKNILDINSFDKMQRERKKIINDIIARVGILKNDYLEMREIERTIFVEKIDKFTEAEQSNNFKKITLQRIRNYLSLTAYLMTPVMAEKYLYDHTNVIALILFHALGGVIYARAFYSLYAQQDNLKIILIQRTANILGSNTHSISEIHRFIYFKFPKYLEEKTRLGLVCKAIHNIMSGDKNQIKNANKNNNLIKVLEQDGVAANVLSFLAWDKYFIGNEKKNPGLLFNRINQNPGYFDLNLNSKENIIDLISDQPISCYSSLNI